MKKKQAYFVLFWHLEKVFIALEAGPSAIDACINNIPRTIKDVIVVSEIYLITMVTTEMILTPTLLWQDTLPSQPPKIGSPSGCLDRRIHKPGHHYHDHRL